MQGGAEAGRGSLKGKRNKIQFKINVLSHQRVRLFGALSLFSCVHPSYMI